MVYSVNSARYRDIYLISVKLTKNNVFVINAYYLCKKTIMAFELFDTVAHNRHEKRFFFK